MTAATRPVRARAPGRPDPPVALLDLHRRVRGDRRNLLQYVRIPQLLVFSTIQPVMFVLLFVFVFGGAIAASVPGGNYVNFLMPGIFVQTVVFGATATGVGLAEDLGRGMIDRFRSLPMARSAVLAGRTFADLIRNLLVVLLMTVVGVLVGFEPLTGGFPAFLLMLAITVAFGYAFSWVSALDRAGGQGSGVGPGRRLHLDLPADVLLERIRSGRPRCRPGCSPSPRSTRSRSR